MTCLDTFHLQGERGPEIKEGEMGLTPKRMCSFPKQPLEVSLFKGILFPSAPRFIV